MNKERTSKQAGNTLALVLVIGIAIIAVAFFVMNYSQLMGTHKEAQTATDAAALAGAKDIGRIVIQSPLGRIALVDDVPAFANSGVTGATADPRPIIGINTLMGTLRLDAIIAGKLTAGNAANGNTSVLFLIQQDLNAANAASALLTKTITNAANGTATVVDKYGIAVNIAADVQNTYTANKVHMAETPQQAPTLTVTVGYLNQTASSSVPTPQPASDDPLTQGMQTYPVYTSIAAGSSGPAANLSFQFVPLSQTLALASNDLFSATPPQGASANAPPTAIQVAATREVTGVAADQTTQERGQSSQQKPKTNMNLVSTAVCGGSVQPAATGTLALSFAAGGIPGVQSAHQAGASSSQMNSLTGASVDFTSVASIMNGAMINLSDPTQTPDGPWNPQSKSLGVWFTASGGDVPGSGTLKATPFKNIMGQQVTNPSISLAFLVYDWLRSLGLRPNIDSAVAALSFSSGQPQSFYQLEQQLTGGSGTPNYTFATSADASFGGSAPAVNSDNWVPPVYAAASGQAPGVTNGLMNISFGNAKNDPRNLQQFSSSPEDYQRQQSNVWGYIPADTVIPDRARMVHVADGAVTTTDGNPASDLDSLWSAIRQSHAAADDTQIYAWRILLPQIYSLMKNDPKFQQIASQRQNLTTQGKSMDQATFDAQSNALKQQGELTLNQAVQKVMDQMPRVKAAFYNARYCLFVDDEIVQNMKALTGLGCKMVSPTHFVIGGADFYPATTAASINALKGNQPVSTGQDSAAKLADWCTPLVNGNKSQLYFYKHANNPVVGSRLAASSWTPPAIAATTNAQNPYNNLKFLFYLEGADPGTGIVHMATGLSPFVSEATLSGQALYQDVQALLTNTTSGKTTMVTVWQVQARDEYANAYPTLSANLESTGVASYFADMSLANGAKQSGNWANETTPTDSNYPQSPALVSEWQLTCPMPVTVCANNLPCTPPPIKCHPTLTSKTSTSSTEITGAFVWNGVPTCPGNTWYLPGCCNVEYAPAVTTTTTTVITNNAGCVIGGYYFYLGGPPAGATSIQSGNGWEIQTSSQTSETTLVQQANTTVSMNHT